MTATKHSRPERHEVCDCVIAIADQLLKVVGYESLPSASAPLACFLLAGQLQECYTYRRLGMIEFDTACKSSLCQEAQLGDDELVELWVAGLWLDPRRPFTSWNQGLVHRDTPLWAPDAW